jgi:phage regulator Rha-like protein
VAKIDNSIVPIERIQQCIFLLRGEKVMLDRDLAELYGVETKTLTRAMKRNIDRFPDDFMFQLTKDEFDNLRRQYGTSSQWGGRRYPPYAFTEHGVAMLSSVLNSPRAIQVNIQIIRTFSRLRKFLATHKDLRRKIESLEKKYDEQFQQVFAVLKAMIAEDEKTKPRIGYQTEAKGKRRKKK